MRWFGRLSPDLIILLALYLAIAAFDGGNISRWLVIISTLLLDGHKGILIRKIDHTVLYGCMLLFDTVMASLTRSSQLCEIAHETQIALLLVCELGILYLFPQVDGLIFKRDHVVFSRLDELFKSNDLLCHFISLIALKFELSRQVLYLGLLPVDVTREFFLNLFVLSRYRLRMLLRLIQVFVYHFELFFCIFQLLNKLRIFLSVRVALLLHLLNLLE